MAKRIVIGIWIVLAMFLGILLLADYSNNKMIENFKNGKIEQNQLGFLGFTQPYVNHYNRGNIYYTLGDFQRAISEYEQALNSSPSAPEDCRIRVNYALSLVKQINPATASDNLEETLELLDEARRILCEHECACEDSEDGHFTYAQRLKDEIDAYEWQLLNPTPTDTPTPTPPDGTPQPGTPSPQSGTPSPEPTQAPWDTATPTPTPGGEPGTPSPQPEPTQAPGDTATPTPQPEPTQDPNNTATPSPQPGPTQAPGDTATPTPAAPTAVPPSPGPSGTPVPTPPQATPTMTPEEEILEIQRRAQNERHPDMSGDGSNSSDYNWGSSACW